MSVQAGTASDMGSSSEDMPMATSDSKTSRSGRSPTVVIIGPPWPHSGTARILENQAEFYRSRGYATIFVCVPIHCSYVESYPEWEDIKRGMREIGADQIFFAPINERRFKREKITAWVRHTFRGTTLDWIVFTGTSSELPEEALRTIQRAQIVALHVNHVYTLGFALRLLRKTVRSVLEVPIILETHDVQSHLLSEQRELNPWTHRLDTTEQLVRSELLLLKRANVLVHCSVEDLDFFKARMPSKPQLLVLPTIDKSFVSSVNAINHRDPIDLLFVGQSTGPNLAAIEWFFDKVWPLIIQKQYRLSIVGKVEMLVRKNLPGIYQQYKAHFLGPVSELSPYYSASRCIIAPMISGTGISIKTVEALALGKPFVGTSKAYRGMPMNCVAACGLQAYDLPDQFAAAIVRTLSDEKSAATASRLAYEALFSEHAVFASRDEALQIVSGPNALTPSGVR